MLIFYFSFIKLMFWLNRYSRVSYEIVKFQFWYWVESIWCLFSDVVTIFNKSRVTYCCSFTFTAKAHLSLSLRELAIITTLSFASKVRKISIASSPPYPGTAVLIRTRFYYLIWPIRTSHVRKNHVVDTYYELPYFPSTLISPMYAS